MNQLTLDLQPTKPLTDKQRVLRLLKAAAGDWTPFLYRRTNTMVHSRVPELRKDGYTIECKRFGLRDYRYKLVNEVKP